jgi:PhnB protein
MLKKICSVKGNIMIFPVLAVKNLDASVKFYTEKLGFKLDFNFAGPDGKNAYASISLPGNNSLMLSAIDSLDHRGQGVVLMLYLADDKDLDTYYKEVQVKGVSIAQPIKDEYWGDRVFSVTDPDGYYLSFAKTIQQMSNDELAKVVASSKR